MKQISVPALLVSKKAQATSGGILLISLLDQLGITIDDDLKAILIASLLAVYTLAQGVADFGKPAEIRRQEGKMWTVLQGSGLNTEGPRPGGALLVKNHGDIAPLPNQ